MAIPAEASAELEIGREYEARSQAEREGERRRAIAWRLDHLERRQGLERAAGR